MTRSTPALLQNGTPAGFVWQSVLAVGLVAIAAAGIGFSSVQLPALLPAVYLAAVSGALCRIDFAEHRLPNALVLPGYAAALAGVAWRWLASGQLPVVAIVGGAAYFAFLLIMNLAGGMGMGDVKLGGLLGLSLGLLGVSESVAGPLLAFVLGGLVGTVVLLMRRAGPRTRIPFGPFLLAGYWIAIALAPLLGSGATSPY